MKKETENLVKAAFKDVTGREAKKVTSMTGAPPSKENSYLYNVLFDQYEGLVEDAAKFKYTFFIFRENTKWSAEFIPQ